MPEVTQVGRRWTSQKKKKKRKGDNEMKPKAVHRSPGVFLTAEENLS